MQTAALCVVLLACLQLGSATLHELAGFMPHPRIARQVSQSEIRRCSNVLLQAQCSTTNYAQDVLNEVSKCGASSAATISAVEGVCRKNPSTGDYCGSAFLDNIDAVLTIQQVCSSSSCSTECRSRLQNITSSAGCCAQSNSAVNVLISPYLSQCNVALPSACPASSLNIPSTSSGSCSLVDLQNLISGFRCGRSSIQPILNALKSGNCDNFVTAVESDCSYRDGQYCYERLQQSDSISALTGSISACTSSSSCSSGCQTQIGSLNDNLGCCVNSVNASFRLLNTEALAPYRTVTSYSLWSACGVNPPGECEVRFSGAASLCGNLSVLLALVFLLMMF